MQKIILCLFLAVTSLALHAQNVVRDPNAQVRNVSAFTKIDISGAINLYLSQGNTQGVAVSSDDANAINKIKTEVRNGVLKVFVENGAWNGWNWGNKHLKAYITFTSLEALDVSGACNVEITDPVSLGDFKLELSGASNLNGTIKANNVHFELSGASNTKTNFTAASFVLSQTGASNFKGSVHSGKTSFNMGGASVTDVSGSATDLVIDASGACNFKGSDLTADNCKVEATGASSASINVNKELQATASGGSSIRYSGAANVTNLDVSGGSTVKKKS
ncbi:head GIN domain-containing protein [Parafilimonas sp.]|uniref:head GIN domain-containing protein n=1 Tax=Parafilimonas sp. TaxID=1969739 RepID=UPI0039E3A4EF